MVIEFGFFASGETVTHAVVIAKSSQEAARDQKQLSQFAVLMAITPRTEKEAVRPCNNICSAES